MHSKKTLPQLAIVQQIGNKHPRNTMQNRVGIVQAKVAPTAQNKKSPVAQPVYRPQPVPKVLQTKKAIPNQPINQSRPAPSVPSVYRPEPKAVQTKMAKAQS